MTGPDLDAAVRNATRELGARIADLTLELHVQRAVNQAQAQQLAERDTPQDEEVTDGP